MKKDIYINVCCTLLIILFVYAAGSKLIDYEHSLREMHNQIFPTFAANILTWLVPTLEIGAILLLLLPSSKIIGLWISLALMSVFTVYIAIVMTGIFGRIPCSCGGILNNMPYSTHLIFNLLVILLTLSALHIHYRKIRPNKSLNFTKERR